MYSLLQAGPVILAAFFASLVECVEALTVILAVASVRGWRPALTGTAAGLFVLLMMVLLFGPALTRISLQTIQLLVGGLLLLFGVRWLRKAILRAAGLLPLHDEDAAFNKESAALRRLPAAAQPGRDAIAILSAFKIVLLEGIEVVFIVIAMGAGGRLLVPAAAGALAALIVVIALGLWLHKPLSRIPENQLKFGVGVLLSAFGTFWVGEGLRLVWPGADGAILALIAGYGVLALWLVWLLPRLQTGQIGTTGPKKQAPSQPVAPAIGWLRLALAELAGLFIDDGLLAAGTLALFACAGLWQAVLGATMRLDGAFFFAGLALLLLWCCRRAAAQRA